jgi:hypothetical protein
MSEKELRQYLRKIGRRGAKATNGKLTAEQRTESARRAARARWARKKDALVAEITLGTKDLLKTSRANARHPSKAK